MSDVLRWVFDLKDQMSGPAQKIASALKGADGSIAGAAAAAKSLGGGFAAAGAAAGATTKGIGGVVSGLGALAQAAASNSEQVKRSFYEMHQGLIQGAEKWAAAGVVGVAGLGLYMAKTAVDAASFAETTKTSLGVVLNSQEAANRVFNDTVTLAARLPITTQAALSAVKSFSLAGYAEKELRNLTIGFADAESTIKGGGENFMRVVNRIKAMGGVEARELHTIPGETGIQVGNIIKGLQAIGYTSIKTGAQLKASIHTIAGQDFVEAMLRAQALQGHGKLGALSDRQSQTLSGLMTTLESRKFELLMDLDTSPGFATLRDFIHNAADALDPKSATGKQLSDAFAATFNDVFGNAFGQFTGPKGAGKLVDMVKTDILPAFRDLATVFGGLLSVTMKIASGWAEIIRWARYFRDGDDDTKTQRQILAGKSLAELKKSAAGGYLAAYPREMVLEAAKTAGIKAGVGPDAGAQQVGLALAQGMAAGVTSGTPLVAAATKDMGASSTDTLASALEVHSPSRVFQELGEMTAKGYALGVMGGIPGADAAIERLGAVPRGAGSTAGGPSARAPIVVHLAVNVDAKGASADDAHSIAAQIGDALPSTIVRAFDMIAAQYGQN